MNTVILTPAKSYLICCIERTGSNLVTHALAHTGIAGRPAEYFNPSEQSQPWMREILGDATIVSGLPKILRTGTTRNGVFAAKLHWNHFRFLGCSVSGHWDWSEQLAPNRLLKQSPDLSFRDALDLLRSRFATAETEARAYDLLRPYLPNLRCVWLTRRNTVARAISHFRAQQTGRWYQPLSDNRPPTEPAPEFDFAEIHVFHCLGCFHDEMWERFFRQRNISPHRVVYEDLVADYEPTIRGILRFLDLADAVDAVPPPVSARQSDALSQEWERRYRAMIGEP